MKIRLDRPAQPIDVKPGGEVILSGSFRSKFDGSEIDAATTTWPDGSPGGASVDAGGLVDFEAGGLHMTSRDPATHVVKAISTGEPGAACQAAGVSSPCIVLRVLPQARSRLLTMNDWTSSLVGEMTVEAAVPPPVPAYAPAVDAATSPYALGALGLLGACALGALAWTFHRKQKLSPKGQLIALARRVHDKLGAADGALAAPLRPAVDAAMDALRKGRVEAGSKEGARIQTLLLRVESRIDDTAVAAREQREQEAADELVHEMEAALEAADEAMAIGGRVAHRK